jgi:hypothetical protein
MARPPSASTGSGPHRLLRAGSVSRRTVLTGASAALVASGCARAELDAIDREGGPTHDDGEADLSLAFLNNARGFYAAALAARGRFPRQIAQSLAIAVELALKSYLLHRGCSDDWNRVHIGHDLCKALSCAQRAGLHDVPPGLPMIAGLLSRYYRGHAFHVMAPQALEVLGQPSTQAVVGALQTVVGQAIRRDRLSGSMVLAISDVWS